MQFSNSRTFPGQEYPLNKSDTEDEILDICLLFSFEYFSKKCSEVIRYLNFVLVMVVNELEKH